MKLKAYCATSHPFQALIVVNDGRGLTEMCARTDGFSRPEERKKRKKEEERSGKRGRKEGGGGGGRKEEEGSKQPKKEGRGERTELGRTDHGCLHDLVRCRRTPINDKQVEVVKDSYLGRTGDYLNWTTDWTARTDALRVTARDFSQSIHCGRPQPTPGTSRSLPKLGPCAFLRLILV